MHTAATASRLPQEIVLLNGWEEWAAGRGSDDAERNGNGNGIEIFSLFAERTGGFGARGS